MNYYRRYIGDYIRDTARLSMLEHGAYTLLLDYYYADEKPLPFDKDELYLIVRAMTPADRKAVDKVIGLYFQRGEAGFTHTRVEDEIARARAAAEKCQANGKQGGRPRKRPDETNGVTKQETNEITGLVSKEQTKAETNDGTGLESYARAIQPPTTNHQPPATNYQPPTNPLLETVSQEGRLEARASRLPPSWTPSPRLVAWTHETAPGSDIEAVLAQFRDHWAAKGERRLDWDATWRTWIRRGLERRGKRTPTLEERNAAAVADWAP